MESLRPRDLAVPRRMRGLPKDHRGFVVPKFVSWIDGKPEFRVARSEYIGECYKRKICWLCGEPMGVNLTFVIGPMCSINRVTTEPPSHHDCATYAALVCPFLTLPKMRRRDAGLPKEAVNPAGDMIERNPGATCLWSARRYTPMKVHNGTLFRIGEATRVEWFCAGREATREEVMQSIRTGLPLLLEPAKAEGPIAIQSLWKHLKAAERFVPGRSFPADIYAQLQS